MPKPEIPLKNAKSRTLNVEVIDLPPTGRRGYQRLFSINIRGVKEFFSGQISLRVSVNFVKK